MQGGCLCGGVRYCYDGPIGGSLGAVTLCHCGQCRKAHGYGAAVAPALAAGFSVTAGSPLYSRRLGAPALLRLRLGSVDNPPADLKIQAHIYARNLPLWAEPEDAARYPDAEPDRRLDGRD